MPDRLFTSPNIAADNTLRVANVDAATVVSAKARQLARLVSSGATTAASNNNGELKEDGVGTRLSVGGTDADTGDVVLLKDQTTTWQNGLWVVKEQGAAGVTPWELERAPGADSIEGLLGSYTFVTTTGESWHVTEVPSALDGTGAGSGVTWAQLSLAASNLASYTGAVGINDNDGSATTHAVDINTGDQHAGAIAIGGAATASVSLRSAGDLNQTVGGHTTTSDPDAATAGPHVLERTDTAVTLIAASHTFNVAAGGTYGLVANQLWSLDVTVVGDTYAGPNANAKPYLHRQIGLWRVGSAPVFSMTLEDGDYAAVISNDGTSGIDVQVTATGETDGASETQWTLHAKMVRAG